MTPEHQQPADPAEEAVENTEEGAEEAAQPTLNRAARRAQAKGKKGAPTPPVGGTHPGNRFGGGSHPSFTSDKTRFPRTGHK